MDNIISIDKVLKDYIFKIKNDFSNWFQQKGYTLDWCEIFYLTDETISLNIGINEENFFVCGDIGGSVELSIREIREHRMEFRNIEEAFKYIVYELEWEKLKNEDN